MELAGQHVRPEPLEGRRKRLGKLLSRSNRVMRDGIQLSEAISGDGAAMFRHACGLGFEGIVSKHIGSRYVSGRTRAWLKTKNHPNPQATFFIRDGPRPIDDRRWVFVRPVHPQHQLELAGRCREPVRLLLRTGGLILNVQVR
jgi:ATP-dependent DNA ligase